MNRIPGFWQLVASDEAATWLTQQDPDETDAISASLLRLAYQGPALGRPLSRQIGGGGEVLELTFPYGDWPRLLYGFSGNDTIVLLMPADQADGAARQLEKVHTARQMLDGVRTARMAARLDGVSELISDLPGLPPGQVIDLGAPVTVLPGLRVGAADSVGVSRGKRP